MPECGEVRLEITEMPEKLYQALVVEFARQFGSGIFADWNLTAVKEPVKRSFICTQLKTAVIDAHTEEEAREKFEESLKDGMVNVETIIDFN